MKKYNQLVTRSDAEIEAYLVDQIRSLTIADIATLMDLLLMARNRSMLMLRSVGKVAKQHMPITGEAWLQIEEAVIRKYVFTFTPQAPPAHKRRSR